MKDLDFSELDSVSGGLTLGALPTLQQQVATGLPLGVGVDPFTQQFGQLGVGQFGAPVVPYNYGYGFDNGGCNGGYSYNNGCSPCGPDFYGQLGVGQYGYGVPGGQLGVNFYPGGQVTAGTQPGGQLIVGGPTFGGPITTGGTLSVGPQTGSPLGFAF